MHPLERLPNEGRCYTKEGHFT